MFGLLQVKGMQGHVIDSHSVGKNFSFSVRLVYVYGEKKNALI